MYYCKEKVYDGLIVLQVHIESSAGLPYMYIQVVPCWLTTLSVRQCSPESRCIVWVRGRKLLSRYFSLPVPSALTSLGVSWWWTEGSGLVEQRQRE